METLAQAQEAAQKIVYEYQTHETCYHFEGNNIYQTIQKISPVQAQVILDSYHLQNNRKKNVSAISAILFEMASGRWMPAISSIKIDEHGKLIDGQHRLSALAMHSEPVTFVIQHNVPREMVKYIDLNLKRTLHDYFNISSKEKISKGDSQLIVALSKGLNKIQHQTATNLSGLNRSNKITTERVQALSFHEIFKTYNQHKDEIIRTVKLFKANIPNYQKTIIRSTQAILAFHLFRKINEANAKNYVFSILNAQNLEPDTVIHKVFTEIVSIKTKGVTLKKQRDTMTEVFYAGFYSKYVLNEKKPSYLFKYPDNYTQLIKQAYKSDSVYIPSIRVQKYYTDLMNGEHPIHISRTTQVADKSNQIQLM